MSAEKALAAFQELAQAGCSFQDALLAVYELGAADARGVAPAPKAAAKKSVPVCPYDAIVGWWNKTMAPAGFVAVRSLDSGRRAEILKCWVWLFTVPRINDDGTLTVRAETKEQGLQWLVDYGEKAVADPWLNGSGPRSKGHEKWKPDIEFMLRKTTMRKMVEKDWE